MADEIGDDAVYGVYAPRRPRRVVHSEVVAFRMEALPMGGEATDPKAEVISRFPGAVALEVPIGGGERRWVVVAEPDWPWRFAVGGGDTEGAAWANALECSGGDGDGDGDVDVDPTHHPA